MKQDCVLITGNLTQLEERARRLVYRTLVQLDSSIDIVAVKIEPDRTGGLTGIGYRCTILLKTLGDKTLRSEACDCDELLAVYEALTGMVNNLDPKPATSNCQSLADHKIGPGHSNSKPTGLGR
ncbi:MAG: hypothetical protein GY867_08375 [bacterium]|nr:hypothetical protein [bacterium]